jgi:tol-pal system protein YbgF
VTRIWPLFLVLFLTSCVSNTDFDRLTRDVRELQRGSTESRKDIDTIRERTAGVVKEDSFTAMREGQADLFSKVNETSSGLQELRGRVDENRYYTEKSLKEFTAEKDLLRAQISGLETQVKALRDRLALVEPQTKPKEPSEAAEKPQETVNGEAAPSDVNAEPVADSKAKAYDAAYQLFKDKKFSESREKFEAFIREYPKADLTDNAQFWIAESHYAEKDFENAILAYETLLKKYPDSEKASGGMLKQGFAFAEIGDIKTGKIILNKLIEKYPNSKEADAAKKKIAELDNKKKPQKKK